MVAAGSCAPQPPADAPATVTVVDAEVAAELTTSPTPLQPPADAVQAVGEEAVAAESAVGAREIPAEHVPEAVGTTTL